jgi:hypothetical protein
MNTSPVSKPAHVPTLTEVIDFGDTEPPSAGAPIVTSGFPDANAAAWAPMATVVLPTQGAVVPELAVSVAVPTPVAAPIAPIAPIDMPSEAQIAQRVLGDVQKQIDGMLDFRLKEAIGPLLARHSEALVRDLRDELSRTMRDVVTRSVAQEMAKLRHR